MNDDSFARIVAEEVKNQASRQHKEYLMLPENWVRWKRAITILNDNLENQLALIASQEDDEIARYDDGTPDSHKMVVELQANFAFRRTKIERFKFHVVARLDEISRMIAMGGEEVEERLKTVDFLRKAISEHRALMEEYDLEPTAIDIALWDSLEGKWAFDDITEENLINA